MSLGTKKEIWVYTSWLLFCKSSLYAPRPEHDVFLFPNPRGNMCSSDYLFPPNYSLKTNKRKRNPNYLKIKLIKL